MATTNEAAGWTGEDHARPVQPRRIIFEDCPVCGQDFDKRGVGQVLHHVKTNHQLGAAYDKGAPPSSGGAFSLLFMTCSFDPAFEAPFS
ncbi:hypothetical protein [Mesorhizobium sp.]|uniref:hypothetical protein n=1 Tax=Mesorhizobium sp. TaxID=1871066 RepID=UPI0025DCE16F|nr:hypothetical protein [Mesorhizobium sp.]